MAKGLKGKNRGPRGILAPGPKKS